MSADLGVRLSDVMQAERDFEKLARGSNSSLSSHSVGSSSDVNMSVRDARKRFEQMSTSSTTEKPGRPPPPKSFRKNKTVSDMSQATATTAAARTTTGKSTKGQSASNQDINSKSTDDTSSKENGARTKSSSSKSLKKSQSVTPSAVTGVSADSSSRSSPSSERKHSQASRKIFKRKSIDKDKMDSTAGSSPSNDSASGRTKAKSSGDHNGRVSSPTHRVKASPRASKKQRSTEQIPSPSSSMPRSLPGKIQRSFSKVLVNPEDRDVQASIGAEDRGKVVGGSRPTSPREIGDGELRLKLTKGKFVAPSCGVLHLECVCVL